MLSSEYRRRLTDYTGPPPGEIREQTTALAHVIDAANARLDTHNIPGKSDVFVSVNTRTGYFRVPLLNGVLDIESMEGPTVSPQAGLFVRIHVGTGDGYLAQLLSIQLPKKAKALEDTFVTQTLGWYPPMKMELLAGYIRKAEPISEEAYRIFMGPPGTVMAMAKF